MIGFPHVGTARRHPRLRPPARLAMHPTTHPQPAPPRRCSRPPQQLQPPRQSMTRRPARPPFHKVTKRVSELTRVRISESLRATPLFIHAFVRVISRVGRGSNKTRSPLQRTILRPLIGIGPFRQAAGPHATNGSNMGRINPPGNVPPERASQSSTRANPSAARIVYNCD